MDRISRGGEEGARRVLRGAGATVAMTAALGLVLALGACRTTPEAEGEGPGSGRIERGAGEFDEGPGSLERRDLEAESARLETVYFDFDSAEIRSDMRPVLQQNARTIRDGGYERVVLEGHTDERGSEQYNLALGERRAHAVKRYLLQLGVPGDRLETVSFGESRPAARGHDESAWRWNRRVEFRVVR